ncbi:MAG: membrane protein insertion efficiency factor YidD [Oscillospiraceae bacterium]|nr:membrane protein insertion efficiency factor YidD [Oscillospiraceae bacterium]
MKKILLAIIGFYRRKISPGLPSRCRFLPTCSEYGTLAIEKYGAGKGSWLLIKRFCKCHPFYRGDVFDPVP